MTRRLQGIAGIAAAALAAAGAGAVAVATAAVAPPPQAATPQLTYVTGLAGARPQVVVANGDGSGARPLGPGVDAAISPDGAQVAVLVSSRNGFDLVVRPAAGGPARTLAHSGETLADVRWSPDSTRLAAAVANRLMVFDVADGAGRVLARGQIQGLSFAPAGDRIVYGRSPGTALASPVNLYVVAAGGGRPRALTHDGRSLEPLWGPSKIAYTHERLRRDDAPVFQLWTVGADGRGARQLTHVKVPSLVSGLIPLAWSADGRRLLAEFGGQDTSEAWTVDPASGRARDLTGRTDGVAAFGLSRDGTTVLATTGSVEDPARQSVVAIPWSGRGRTTLARHGSNPSWNR